MPTLLRKRSIIIAGHKTSVSLEDAFWNGLKDVAHMSLSNMIAEINTGRDLKGNLSSAIPLRRDLTPVLRRSVEPATHSGHSAHHANFPKTVIRAVFMYSVIDLMFAA